MKTFEAFLVEHGVVGYHDEPVVFKSGISSHLYVNCRRLSQTLSILEDTAAYVVDFLKEQKLLSGIDAVLGVPEGASELGNAVQRGLIRNSSISDTLFAFRKKAKEHGDPANRYWVNGNVPRRILILEDVTTTGGSAVEFAGKLIDAGVEVTGVVGLVNRLNKVNGKLVVDTFAEARLPYYSLTTLPAVLPTYLNSVDAEKRRLVEAAVSAEFPDL